MDITLETGYGHDPRIKSPDDALQHALKGKTAKKGDDAQQTIHHLEQELQMLRQRYNNDIHEWREYEKRVKKWKELVLSMVQRLKVEKAK